MSIFKSLLNSFSKKEAPMQASNSNNTQADIRSFDPAHRANKSASDVLEQRRNEKQYVEAPEAKTPEMPPIPTKKNTGFSFLENYLYNNNEPDPVDKKRIKNAQTFAAITDALSLIAQAVSAGKGAYVQGGNQYATPLINTNAQQLRNQYKQNYEAYQKGKQEAAEKDYAAYLQNKREEQNQTNLDKEYQYRATTQEQSQKNLDREHQYRTNADQKNMERAKDSDDFTRLVQAIQLTKDSKKKKQLMNLLFQYINESTLQQ